MLAYKTIEIQGEEHIFQKPEDTFCWLPRAKNKRYVRKGDVLKIWIGRYAECTCEPVDVICENGKMLMKDINGDRLGFFEAPYCYCEIIGHKNV